MARSLGEVVRVPARAEKTTRAKEYAHRSNFLLCSRASLPFCDMRASPQS